MNLDGKLDKRSPSSVLWSGFRCWRNLPPAKGGVGFPRTLISPQNLAAFSKKHFYALWYDYYWLLPWAWHRSSSSRTRTGVLWVGMEYAWFFNDWLGDLKEMLSYFKSLHWWHFSLTHLMKFWNILQIFGQAFKSRLQTKPTSSPSPNIDIAGRYICN